MWNTILSIFVKKVLGELFAMLLKNTASALFKSLTDKENTKKAYEVVKELNARKDLSTKEKAEMFNLMMLDWAKSTGRELKDSTLNCLREFAVNILKMESENALKAEQPSE